MNKLLNTSVEPIISYAQNKEDIILASFFKDVKNGFYVDIGAAHPDYLSVTKYFYIKGWSGINVEPNQRLYDLILKSRPRDSNYKFAVSDSKKKTAVFREYLGDGLSTLSSEVKKDYSEDGESSVGYYNDYEVPVVTLESLLKKDNPKTIHFMKVDVEGFEYEVLKSNDWSKFRPRIMCIETNHSDNKWAKMIEKQHYTRIYHDGLNDYYADDQYYDLLPKIDYNFIFNPRVISPSWAQMIERQQRTLRDKASELKQLYRIIESSPTLEGENIKFVGVVRIIFKKIDAVIVGKLIPKRETNMSDITKGVVFSETSSYDKEIWSTIVRNHESFSHNFLRRALFKLYKGFRKAMKIATHTVRNKK